MRLSSGRAHDRPGVQHDLLAVGAVAAFRDHDGDHRVADLQPIGNAVAHLVDDPRSFHARHVGRRIGLLHLGARAVAGPDVGRIDRRGVDADPDFSRPGVDFGQVDDLENLGSAMGE